MASTSSLKSVIKSEKFPCQRIPNQSIPPVIVINDASQHSSAGTSDSNSEPANSGQATSSPASSQPMAPSRAPNEMPSRPKYGRVVISLENPILPEETIKNTPSQIDGLDCETENDLRITGCKLIQISGVLLRLPQVAMATGQVLFQRYYYSKSFVRFPMEITAMACVVLASKVEEAPRRIRDVINVFHNMKQIRLNQTPVPMFLNEAYVTMKNNVIKAERRILKELGFCVHVKHPHKYIITVAEILGNSKNTELIQAAWSYMNDSLQSNVFVRFSPETIACACIHLSARILREPLPTRPPWHLVFGVDTETINQVCTTILQLYTRVPLSQEELEERVDFARRAVDDAKVKARAQLVAQNAENATTAGIMDSLVDSRTNSPIKYSDHGGAGGGSISSKLEVISALNRVKQHQASGLASKSSYSPLVKSAIATSNVNSALNSATNTPIKLEKSPRTLAPFSSSSRSKRSRSPTPSGSRSSSPRRSRKSRSRSSSGDDRRNSHHDAEDYHSGRDRYRNGHQNTANYYAESDSRPRKYREANDDSNMASSGRSPTPPRSYITSRVSAVSNNNNSDYYSNRSSAKSSSSGSYRDSRYDDSSRYPPSSSSSNRYDYRSSGQQRGNDRYREVEYEESRRGGDRDRDRDRDHYRQDDYRPRSRDYRDEGGRSGNVESGGGTRSRSRSPYQYRSSSSRDYHKSSSSSSGRNKSRY